MKLSEYMRNSETVFFDITSIEEPMRPTLHYVIENVDVTELAQLMTDLQSVAHLLSINESEGVKSAHVRRLISMLSTCLLVDYLQGHAEVIRELIKAPMTIIPESPPSTSENT